MVGRHSKNIRLRPQSRGEGEALRSAVRRVRIEAAPYPSESLALLSRLLIRLLGRLLTRLLCRTLSNLLCRTLLLQPCVQCSRGFLAVMLVGQLRALRDLSSPG